MSYKTTVSLACANRASALTEIYSQLEAMGWTKFDYQALSRIVPYTSVDATNNWVNYISHGFNNGDHVWFTTTGTAPGNLTAGNMYFIVNVAADTFKLSSTYGGGAIDITSQGTGNHTFSEGYRVYKSQGEDSLKMAGFIRIDNLTANRITCVPYYWWNATTHAGLGTNSLASQYITTSETSLLLWVYGDKDAVMFVSKVATTYYRVGFCHIAEKIWTIQTDLTVAATIGSNVTLTVTSTAGFIADYYQIVGALGEGRDRLQVTNITDDTHLVVASLPRNYGIGSIIGQCPLAFGSIGETTINWYPICESNAVGTGDYAAQGNTPDPVVSASYTDPDFRGQNQYVISPLIYGEKDSAGTFNSFIGYIKDNFFYSPATSLNNEDTFEVNRRDSGTAESAGVNTLTDTDKSWTIDAWIGKVVIIIGGQGAGQIRKIASNTATQLTITENWYTLPNATSQYVIADEAWRYLTVNLALREGK